MEVKFNTDIISVAPSTVRPVKSRPAAEASAEAAFVDSARLDQAMNEAPDIRPEAVQRGKELIGSVQYPPVETMNKIARLLALEIKQ